MSAQMIRIVCISLLAGFVAGGFVWYLWGGMGLLREAMKTRLARRKLKADAAALLKQAEDAKAKGKAT